MYFTVRRCEEYFKGRSAEFAVLLLFNMFMCLFYSLIYGDYMILHNQFVFSLMYVWCKLEPDQQVSIWGFPVKSGNLPWVLILMSILTGGDPFKDLIGIAAGHTYIYIKKVLPLSHGYNLLATPKLIEDLVRRLEIWGHGGRAPRNVFGMGEGGAGQRIDVNARNQP